MIETIKDERGNLQGVCEWWLVDSMGHFDTTGKFIWIHQLEFSSSVNGNGVGLIKEMIKRICAICPSAQFGYFWREKYNRKIKMYSRYQWLKFANRR